MQSVIEELYYGNISFDNKDYSKDSSFVKAAQLKKESYDKLEETLNDSEKELFEKFSNAQGEIESIVRYDSFTYALKFGILLMMEVLMGRGEVCGED